MAHDQHKLVNLPSVEKIERAAEAVDAAIAKASANAAPPEAVGLAQSIFSSKLLWQQRTVTACFWNGSPELQEAVIDRARSWTNVADIELSFFADGKIRMCSSAGSADVRIVLDAGDPRPLWSEDQVALKSFDWSVIGRRSKQSPALTTLSLVAVGKMLEDGDQTSADFDIRHEFGHALGLLHEHQRELCAGWFNLERIAKDTGLTVPQVTTQVGVLATTSPWGPVAVDEYDRHSIMQYNFALSWYAKKEGQQNPCSRDYEVADLSPGDVAGIQALYGVRPQDPDALAANDEADAELALSPLADASSVAESATSAEVAASAPADPAEEEARQQEALKGIVRELRELQDAATQRVESLSIEAMNEPARDRVCTTMAFDVSCELLATLGDQTRVLRELDAGRAEASRIGDAATAMEDVLRSLDALDLAIEAAK